MAQELSGEKLPPGLPLRAPAPPPTGFFPRLRRFFARGLAVLLPTLLTLIILLWAYGILDRYVAEPLNQGLQLAIAPLVDADTLEPYRSMLPPADRPGAAKVELMAVYWQTHRLGWVGLVAALLLVYLVGMFVGSFIGRGLWRMIEGGLKRVPLIKQVYPYVKQVTDFVLNERPLEFSRVVLVQYPSRGIWSMGFVTGRGFATLSRHTGREMLAVFVPSSPTPVTGYVIQVGRDEVLDVPMSIDEALRFAISAGVIVPATQQLAAGNGANDK